MMSEVEYESQLKKLQRQYHRALEKKDCLAAGILFTKMNALANERIRELEAENDRLDEIIKEKSTSGRN